MRGKKTQSHHLLVTFVAFFVVVVHSQTKPDCEVMLGIRSKLTLPKGYWEGDDCCDNTKWAGVQCDSSSHVIRIRVKDRDGGPITVTGELPDTLKDLVNLQHLEFRGENIKIGGPLPTLSGLSQLQAVVLGENSFTSIPRDFFQGLSSLQWVFLDNLPLSPWMIPDSLSTCSALRNFSAGQAGLVGNIPGLFNSNNFAALVELHLGSNVLEGELPKNFSTLTTLQSLWLNGQNLSGRLDVLKDMTSLEQVWLNKNSFTGPLPDFSNLTALSEFNVWDNRITGPVPPSLQTLPGLRVVNLSNNYFQGPFPKFGATVQVDLLPGSTMLCSNKCSENTEKMLAIASFYGYPESLLPTNDRPSGNDSCKWLVVTCRDADTITVVNFQKKGLSGTVSPLFADIKSLETINLADNQLSGPIPKELTTLPSLRVLDVSNNKLSGEVPSFKDGVLKAEGNPQYKGVPRTPSAPLKSPHHKDGLSTGLKIGICILSGIGGVLLVALLVFCKRSNHSSLSVFHRRNKKKSPNNIEVFLEKYGCLALRYKYSEIRKMVNSFKDILGQGGYGRVFKGELPDGRLVAVKLLNESKGDGEDFINEVTTIGRANHVNVVNLVGFCIEGTRRALVYEFMPNGSLERFIYTQKESSTTLPLGWEKLYEIALGIANGLKYLHCGCNTRILHFDIKPHNILLDQNFCPKISDFGLAKLYPSKESVISTVGARGTMGYIAPELCCRTFGSVSHKSDVYSYGMMMLEMIGGRKNIDTTVDNISKIYFPLWIYNHLKRSCEAKGLEEIQAREVFEDEKAKKMILVALWCIQAHPMDRPSMSKVVEMLEGNIHELQMPPNPSVDPRSSSSTSS